MNIIFFSESNIRGKLPRNFENARTEIAWAITLDAEWCPLNESPTGMEVPRSVSELYDLGIIIIPKNNPNIDLSKYKLFCKNVAVMQEGPHWYFQDYDIENQFAYYDSVVNKSDWVYCHNESDVNYYLGLGCKDVRVMRSLMITDGLLPRSEWGDGTMIGGNFVSWYGGFDSYVVALNIGNQISAPSMGRKHPQENMIPDIKYLPYMSWRDWINSLSQYNIGVHLMRTHAAGTFAMNCGFHGIPCIGYKGLDTQEILHPLTTVEVGDLAGANEVAEKLKDDKFYNLCSDTIQKRFNANYTEKVWKRNWELRNK